MRKKSINIGTIFHYLEVIEYLGSINERSTYKCLCECGNHRNVTVTELLRNVVKHCGCRNWKLSNNDHVNVKYSKIESSFREKASGYKSTSKMRGIEFSLTIEETISLLQKNCFYCNKMPLNTFISGRKITILYNGIDRVDNTKGYTLENVVTCCSQCNTAKLNFTIDEFKTWIISLYENFIIKK